MEVNDQMTHRPMAKLWKNLNKLINGLKCHESYPFYI